MGKYMRKRKNSGEVSTVMEVSSQSHSHSHSQVVFVGVRTRSKTRAMASSSLAKTKRSVSVREEPQIQSRTRRRILDSTYQEEEVADESESKSKTKAKSLCLKRKISDLVSESQCSSNGSTELVTENSKAPMGDVLLGIETEASTCLNDNNRESREATPLSDLQPVTESSMMPSQETSRSNFVSRLTVEVEVEVEVEEVMPSKDEINDFFDEAEKKEQQRFTELYNYDIVNNVPLEGRYEWVPLTP